MFHGVPIRVMMNDYGCDDIEYLLSVSDRSAQAHSTASRLSDQLWGSRALSIRLAKPIKE